MAHLIAPSILSADFGSLQKDIEMINQSQADWFHVDIMDGVFVPNISFGFPVLSVLKKCATKPLDVHLMIVDPDRYISRFAEAGASVLTVHWEACTHLHRTLAEIKRNNMKAGVALNPHTPVHLLEDIIKDCDLICLMSVNPGFGGQKFIEQTYEKIKKVRQICTNHQVNPYIEIDGGVDLNNASQLIACGADVLVAGNTVFSAPSPASTIGALKKLQSADTLHS